MAVCELEGPTTLVVKARLYEAAFGMDRQEFPKLPADIREFSRREELFEFNAVLVRACERHPGKRYATATAMHQDLQVLQAGRSMRRVHRLEKRLAVGRKLSLIVLVLAVFAGGLLLQARRTAKTLAKHLSSLHISEGMRYMEENSLLDALPHFVEALRVDQYDRERTKAGQMRVGTLLELCPIPVGAFNHGPVELLGGG